MENFPDRKCVYGYMTLCQDCKTKAPKHVDTSKPIKESFPKVQCEICKRKSR